VSKLINLTIGLKYDFRHFLGFFEHLILYMIDKETIEKYNVPGPRYTSYPTVPFWKEKVLDAKRWSNLLEAINATNNQTDISLYIHLPFCESLCTFCGCHKYITKNHNKESNYIDSVLKEWELYQEQLPFWPKIKELHLGGGTPTFFHPNEIKRLVEGLFSMVNGKIESCELSFEAHPGTTSDEHLTILYQIGFRRISFGIQDYDEKVQRAIHRIQTFKEVGATHQKAIKNGYTVNHDLVYGLPFQTLDGFKNTINKTIRLRPSRIALYSYAHVPWIKGTGQRGYKDTDLPKDFEKRAIYEMAFSMLQEAGYISIGMDHFALPDDALSTAFVNGTMSRNFMGYTTQSTPYMIGLGMSAISDIWDAFAQNDKNITSYQKQVENGIIPIFRGHILSDLDLEIRQYIQDLMCNFETSFRIDSEFQSIHKEIKEKLQGLILDGLLVITGNQVKATVKGRPFIRNICMAFDQDLKSEIVNTNLFSKTI
jgi:oxygen-independent coproporphyrinogen-3 oxidase